MRASKRRRRSSVRSQELNDTKQSKADQQNDQQTLLLLLVNGAEPKSPEESAPNITTTARAVTIVNSHKMKIYRVRSVARREGRKVDQRVEKRSEALALKLL